VSVKKATGKSKTTAKKRTAKKNAEKMPVDMVQVRESINNLVGASARKIAVEVIKVALTGQLATAKYLFEAVGLYPPTEQTEVRPIETSLAHTLLTRMGIPLEPVVSEEEDPTPLLKTAAKGAEAKAEEVAEDGEAETEQVLGEGAAEIVSE
jgi:hypothetical protein